MRKKYFLNYNFREKYLKCKISKNLHFTFKLLKNMKQIYFCIKLHPIY